MSRRIGASSCWCPPLSRSLQCVCTNLEVSCREFGWKTGSLAVDPLEHVTFTGFSFHAFLSFADEYGSTHLCYAPMNASSYVYIYTVSQKLR